MALRKQAIGNNAIPEWFSLARYAECRKWPLELWAANIAFRKFLIGQVTDRPLAPYLIFAIGNPIYEGESEGIAGTLLSRLIVSPKIAESRAGNLPEPAGETLGRETRQAAIWPMGAGFPAEAELPCDQDDLWYDAQYRGRFFAQMSGVASIHVDFSLPDELLVTEFKQFIVQYRKEMELVRLKREFCDEDIAEWCDYQVLPYLDLSIWTLWWKISLTQEALGKAIYPDEYDVSLGERVRKVTRPKAEWLLRDEVWCAMSRQAYGVSLY